MNTQPIPASTTFQDGLTGAQRFESYRYAARPLCRVEPMRDRGAEDARCSGWLVDDVMVGRSSFTWTRFQRSKQQALHGGGFLLETGKGEQVGEVDGHPVRIDEGKIVLRDLTRPFDTVGYSDDLTGFIIPRYRIEHRDWLERHAPVVTFSTDAPGGRILLNTIHSVMDLVPRLAQSAASDVTAGLIGLLNGLLSTEQSRAEPGAVSSPQAVEANLDTMKTFLVDHLGDPDLSVSTLMQSFHCSRASVYRLFADEGGVAAFIRRERLTRCYDALSRAGQKSGVVQEVAERYGFLDPYHFSRLFKRMFGSAPSKIVGSGGSWKDEAQDGIRAKGAQIHNWLLGAIETHAHKHQRLTSMAHG